MIPHCLKCKSVGMVNNGHINLMATPVIAVKTANAVIRLCKNPQPLRQDIKRLALQMHLEGLSFNSTGKILKVSHAGIEMD